MQSENRLAQFSVQSKLGQGSFSCVYKVKRIDDGKYYAMKKVKIGQMKQKQKQNALNQVRILASISHPNIVNYRQAFFDDRTQTLCIVMQLADAGDIQKKINQHLKYNTHFNQTQIWQALIQMTRGLKVLHQINIMHRDLKCANVFCTSDRLYKLGDLNVSKVAKRGMARTQTGTPYYTSPEVWNDRPYDAKCDIWSLGCVVYEMATLRPPFRASNLKQLYNKIQKGIYEPLPKFYSEQLRTVVGMCLKISPTQRPAAGQILQHPFVIKNTPANQASTRQNNRTSKCNLLKTIIVPKNLKSLKQALPGSKYDQPQKPIPLPENKFRRVNSASNVRQIPQVINSPKYGANNNQILKYAFNRRPSQQNKQFHSQRPEPESVRIVRKMERNISVDYMRRRVESNQSIDNSMKRNNSRDNIKITQKQTPKLIPRPVSRGKQEKVIVRAGSRQMVRPSSREIRSNSREISGQIRSSRQRVNSRDLSKERERSGIEQISKKCKQVQDRINMMMQKKRQAAKQQRNPNLPYIKQPILNQKDYNYIYQRPSSRQRQYSRNKSIQMARQESNKQNESKKSVERPSSRERLQSLERNRRMGVQRYGY